MTESLIDSSGKIKSEGFDDYREAINKTKGDFDFMVGIVKNFEYTSRDDGGFDCKTDIISTGVNILTTNTVSEGTSAKLKLYDVKETDTIEEQIEKLKAIKDDDTKMDRFVLNARVIRSDFCFIVLILAIFNLTYILLPFAAVGAQIYWVTDLFERARGYRT